MDARWRRSYGRIERRSETTRISIEVLHANGRLLTQTLVVSNLDLDLHPEALRQILDAMVEVLDKHLSTT